MKKIILLLSLLIYTNTFCVDDLIGAILEHSFGLTLRVGLVSYGAPQKFTIKSIGGSIEIITENKIIDMEPNSIYEIKYSNGFVIIDGEEYTNVEIRKKDIVASIGVSSDGKNFRIYRGFMEVLPERDKNGLLLINNVLSEEYLYSVVACEIDPNFGAEAIKAQAVAARTYLYAGLKIGKHKGYDLVDTTADQVYKGMTFEKELVTNMVNETENEIMTFEDEPIAAYYHANSGGKTANIEDVWIGAKPLSYLKAVFDTDGVEKTRTGNWQYKISKSDISRIFNDRVEKISVVDMRDGRVYKVKVNDKVISGAELRKLIGYTNLPSTMFSVEEEWGAFIFNGKGSGHGVGMSQVGAAILGEKGFKYIDILKYYYTGIEIKSVEKTKKYDIIKKALSTSQ